MMYVQKKWLVAIALICVNIPLANAQTVDWGAFEEWENSTRYSKTYVVDQKHPAASDENPGTRDAPLKTINKAAQLVNAGERVLIRAGVYRELIEPKHQGRGANRMIAYEAAPGERVVVKGSRIIKTNWVQRSVYTDVLPDSSLQYTWSRKIWMTTLPDAVFEEGYFPFQLPNILPEEYLLMPWAEPVKDRVPYTSTRGMLWQDGKRMVQLDDYGDLARMPGSFWVDVDGRTVHIHPYGGDDPSQYVFEAGVQSHLFRPQGIGFGYIHLKGIAFQHCPNGFLRTSTGAVTTRGGHHWIIEDNDISEVNSAALEFGYYAFEFEDPTPDNIQPRTDPDLGGVIVRNNRIFEAGTAGMRSYTVTKGIIEGNTIWNIGWHDAQNYWECSGIKLLRTRNTVVRNNHIFDITAGNGIWMDWDIRHSRVSGNVIHNVQTIQGGIFVEAAQVPNLVDNNVVFDIDGSGVYVNDSDSTLIYHNLVARTTGPVVTARVATQRQLGGRWLTANYNRVLNNLFIDGGQSIHFESNLNETGQNLYVSTREPVNIGSESMAETSTHLRASLRYNMHMGYLHIKSQTPFPKMPALHEVRRDFYASPLDSDLVYPGPFAKIKDETKLLLGEGYIE